MPILGEMYHWGDKAKNVPEKPGVYTLYDKDGNLTYVGKSANLRKEFTKILNTNLSDDRPFTLETKYYKRELTSNHENRMKELLEEYRQKHGKPPKFNQLSAPPEKEVTLELGFHFYEDIDKPLREVAVNKQELGKKMSRIPVASLEFHQKRGDFANWIKEVLEDPQLAETIQKIDRNGEDLRNELLDSLNIPDKIHCPVCDAPTRPVKTWKMAGRPSKTGERLQLTIGYYKCHKCKKTFRQVLAKEKIKAS